MGQLNDRAGPCARQAVLPWLLDGSMAGARAE